MRAKFGWSALEPNRFNPPLPLSLLPAAGSSHVTLLTNRQLQQTSRQANNTTHNHITHTTQNTRNMHTDIASLSSHLFCGAMTIVDNAAAPGAREGGGHAEECADNSGDEDEPPADGEQQHPV